MKPLTAQEVAFVTSGTLVAGAETLSLSDVFTDTRKPVAGGLFIALRGERFDGHAFAANAVEGGAAAVLVSDLDALAELPAHIAIIEVDNTLRALTTLASVARERMTAKVVAITGSVGKTTVKDMCAAALSAFGKVGRTPGNFNNHIGLPLTLCGLDGDEDFVVLELGMSAPGEITELANLARPHVGLVTGAAAAHLEFFDSVDAIADAKAELFSSLSPGAVAIFNADDSRIAARAPQLAPGQLVSYGAAAGATVHVTNVRLDRSGLTTSLSVAGDAVSVRLRALGTHSAHNAAAATAVVHALGLEPSRAVDALRMNFRPAKHRLELSERADGFTVLDDCYNANPTSMRAALQTLADITPADASLGAVIGTMGELGSTAPALHEEIGAFAKSLGYSFIAATGALAADIARGAAGIATLEVAHDASEIEAAVSAFALPGRFLLVKGSRSERLERIVDSLLADNDPSTAVTTPAARGGR